MGFEPIVEKDGSINKMLVRAYTFVLTIYNCHFLSTSGSQSGDVHLVDFSDGKTDYEYTQLLWRLAGS